MTWYNERCKKTCNFFINCCISLLFYSQNHRSNQLVVVVGFKPAMAPLGLCCLHFEPYCHGLCNRGSNGSRGIHKEQTQKSQKIIQLSNSSTLFNKNMV